MPNAPTNSLFARRAGIPLVLAAVCFLVYAPTFSYPFVNYDDPVFVVDNPHVNQGLTADGVRWALGIHGPSQYHPLTWLSHMLDVQLFGLAPGAHHAVNVVIHALTTVLLYHFLLTMTGAACRSAAVAALFGWHPTRVEAVAWIAERKELLCALLVIVTLIAYARYARRRGWRRYAWVVVAYALALASKPMAITVPVLLLLLNYWPLARFAQASAGGADAPRPRAAIVLLDKLPLLLMALASCVLSYLAQLDANAVASLADVSLTARIGNAIVSCVRYLRMAVVPTSLACFYPRQPWQPWQVIACAAVLAAITVGVIYSRKRYAIVGWGWYLIALAPAIGILQVGEQAMADRYAYLPLIGVFVMVVWALAEAAGRWPRARGAVPIACTVVLAGYVGITARQVTYWRSDEALFAHAVAVTRDNDIAEHLLGVALAGQGRLDEAAAHYARAAAANPRFIGPRLNLGILADQRGDFAASERWLGEALTIEPKHYRARFALANLRLHEGRPRDAANLFEQLADQSPQDLAARVNLGAALEMLGDRAGAEGAYRAALKIDPDDADARANLDALLKRGAPQP
jgi:tetratricopeptide (TPR) repeat protein